MGLTWTIHTHDGAVQADDYMGDGGTPTIEFGESGTFKFDFGRDEVSHEVLLRLIDLAETFDIYQALDGRYYFRDQTRGNQLLVGIDAVKADLTPPDATVARVWGLIDEGDDTTPAKTGYPRKIELQVTMLARFEEFASRADFQQQRGASGP